MAGEIRRLLNRLVEERSKGNPLVAGATRAKIIIKGVSFKKYGPTSSDDEAVISRVRQIANEMGIKL